jgi:undecaprenyl-diphosphatase
VLVGTLSAFVFSYVSIAWLLGYLQRRNTWIFVWYRLAFGAAILSAVAVGALKNT